MEYYTYAYLREDGTPYYIGKGKGNRINEKQGRRFNLPPKERRIILKRFESEITAYKHEVYMIFILGRKDLGTGILRNLSDGGEGSNNPSQETREYFSKLHKGKVYSKEVRDKISKSRMGIQCPEHLKEKYKIMFSGSGNPNYGKKHSPETLAKISAATKNKNLKTRWYISPDGNEVRIENLREFCEVNDLNHNCMINLHNGYSKSHKGWKRKDIN